MKVTQPGRETDRDESQAVAQRPLVIAVEHGLLSCNLMLETLIAYLKPHPGRLLQVFGWAWRGSSYLKRRLAETRAADVETLPVNEALVNRAAAEAEAGRSVFLASNDSFLASSLMKRFPFITDAITGDELHNPKGMAIADALKQRFAEGFDYAAGPAAPLDVWRQARSAILIGAPSRSERRIAALVPVAARIPGSSQARALLTSLRLHQWVKNLLIFAPFILGGQLGNIRAWLATAVAFLALGLVASSTYLINDIVDVADDRRHWSKRERPIARGLLPLSTAGLCAAAGLAGGLAIAGLVSLSALVVVLAYVALTLSYSLGLKRLPLVDGLVLATLFTLRLTLGVAATQVPPSPWLFVFSMFLFTSLSLAKRYTELVRSSTIRGSKVAVRGYRTEDAPLVLAVGVAAGLSAVIIMILYIIEDAFRESFYGDTLWLWGFPPVIFLLICRMWLVTARGEMNDDPVKFMIKDGPSRLLLAVLMTCFAFAWLA